MIRDYRPEDFETVARIHAQNSIDYKMPNLNEALWLVTRVAEIDGVVRAALGNYIQVEQYLWLDKSDWSSPEEKLEVVHQLDIDAMTELWFKGITCAVLYLPPGMDRFGERLTKEFGYTMPRAGWRAYSKEIKEPKREDLHKVAVSNAA